MSILIKNWSEADWKELLKWAKIGLNNAMIGEFAEVEELPPHGRLIDGDAVVREIESFCGTHWTTMEIKRAPTIIPAEEG